MLAFDFLSLKNLKLVHALVFMALDISEIILSSNTLDLLEESDAIFRNYNYNYTVTNGTNISTTNFNDTTNITTINDGCNNGDFSDFLTFIDIAFKVTTAVIVISTIDLVYDVLKCIHDFTMVSNKCSCRCCCELLCWIIGKEIIDITLLFVVVSAWILSTLRSCKGGKIDDDYWHMLDDDEMIDKMCRFQSCPAQIDEAIDDLSEVSKNLNLIILISIASIIFGPLFPLMASCFRVCSKSNDSKVAPH